MQAAILCILVFRQIPVLHKVDSSSTHVAVAVSGVRRALVWVAVECSCWMCGVGGLKLYFVKLQGQGSRFVFGGSCFFDVCGCKAKSGKWYLR